MYLTRELYEGQIMVSQKETGESIIMVPRDHSFFFFNEKVGTKFQIAKQWAKDIHLKYSTSENLQKKMWQMFRVNVKDTVVNSIESHLVAYVGLLAFTLLETHNILNLFQ